jgi:hypothetical protein
MNRQMMADLGLSFGSRVYIVSQRGWSGSYIVTDVCPTYGTIDIFVADRSSIPRWGVETGISITPE